MTLKNGAILYSLPVNLSNRAYKKHVFDKDRKIYDINMEFFAGESFKGKKEKTINKQRALLVIRFFFYTNVNYIIYNNISFVMWEGI